MSIGEDDPAAEGSSYFEMPTCETPFYLDDASYIDISFQAEIPPHSELAAYIYVSSRSVSINLHLTADI
jgi:hypothetical protein